MAARALTSLGKRGAVRLGMSGAPEFFGASGLGVLLVLFGVVSVCRGKFDSDEAAHLHVAWSWTQGFVQYRDLFDNHMPLFHLAIAPVAGLIGERAEILYRMRFVGLVFYLVTAGATYSLGSTLFSRRTGVWSVLALGFFAPFYVSAYHFGANNLWVALWLLSLTAIVRGFATGFDAARSGLLFGLCFAVSMKTVTLLLSLIIAGAIVWFAAGRKQAGPARALGLGVAFLLTAALVPLLTFGFFAANGLWPELRYGVFDYNFLAENVYAKFVLYRRHPLVGIAALGVSLPLMFGAARLLSQSAADTASALRRAFVALVTCSHAVVLFVFWPPISRTHAPIYPLLWVVMIGALFAVASRPLRWGRLIIFPAPVLLVFVEAIASLTAQPWRVNKTGDEIGLLHRVLRLTNPSDPVFDAKGETIFRPRCFRPLLERIAVKAMKRGLLKDDSIDRLIATRTCVVATLLKGRFPKKTKEFIEANYIAVADNVMVAGSALKRSGANSGRSDFSVAIPADYKLVSGNKESPGILDGVPYSGRRFLDAGPHTFEPTTEADPIAVVWAQAVERGFYPMTDSQLPGQHRQSH